MGQEFLLTVFTQGEAIAEDDGFLPAVGSLVAAEMPRLVPEIRSRRP
jgi:hypothetical protein